MPIIRGRGFHSYRDYKNFAVWTRVTIVPCPLTLETPFPSREQAKQTCPPVNRMPLSGVKRTLLGERVMSAPDAVDGAHSAASKCYRLVCVKARTIEGGEARQR